MTRTVMAQVAALPQQDTDSLKKMWQDLFGNSPPPYNKAFLVKRVSYRLQELAFGGLSEATEARLTALANDAVDPVRMKRHKPQPVTGTRLIREWQGVAHQVTVLDDGFEYRGCWYQSLSVIARTITGTRWSGPVFFGLKKSGGEK